VGQHAFELAPGDTLLMMSDGLPKRLNGTDEKYGYPRVEALFAEVAMEALDTIIYAVLRLLPGGFFAILPSGLTNNNHIIPRTLNDTLCRHCSAAVWTEYVCLC